MAQTFIRFGFGVSLSFLSVAIGVSFAHEARDSAETRVAHAGQSATAAFKAAAAGQFLQNCCF
eukprot:scaffold5865_cov71-Phaeocystis_antarctica.AAC.3